MFACFVFLRHVSCAPNVISVSGLTILDRPFISSNVYITHLISRWQNITRWWLASTFKKLGNTISILSVATMRYKTLEEMKGQSRIVNQETLITRHRTTTNKASKHMNFWFSSWVAGGNLLSNMKKITIWLASSGILDQLRDKYSKCRCCWNVVACEWKVYIGKIEIISLVLNINF